MIYKKYTFKKESDFDKKIKGIENYTAIPVTCVKTPAVIKEGKVITEAVIDSNYNVDILWENDEPKSFVPFQVYPKGIGQHIVAGWEDFYISNKPKV
jgi:hypothetical protein